MVFRVARIYLREYLAEIIECWHGNRRDLILRCHVSEICTPESNQRHELRSAARGPGKLHENIRPGNRWRRERTLQDHSKSGYNASCHVPSAIYIREPTLTGEKYTQLRAGREILTSCPFFSAWIFALHP